MGRDCNRLAELILCLVDRETGYTVPELSERLDASENNVQRALELLMERGVITSTPDWRYRLARRASSVSCEQ